MGEKQPKNPKQKRMLCQLQHQGQKIEEKSKALTGYTKSFKIGVKNDTDPFRQNIGTRKAVQYRLIQLLDEMKALKFVQTLSITFQKMSQDCVVNK